VGWQGKSITVPYPGTFSAVDKSADTPVTPQVPVGGNSVTLTLSKHKVVPFLVEDFGAAQANMALMDRYLEPAVIGIAEQFELDLWMTAMTAGSIAAIGTVGSDMTSTTVRLANRRLNEAKSPVSNRSLVVSPKDQMGILGDTNLASFFAYSQPDSVRNGQFGRLYGFDAYWSQMAPLGYNVAQAAASTYTFNAQTTASVPTAGLTAAVLQAALVGLSSVGTGGVVVSGPAGGPFNVVFTPTIDATGTLTASTATISAHTQTNIALHRDAVMFAVRPFPQTPFAAGVYTAQANDPESGLSIRISAQYDINNIGVRVNLDMLYGVQVLRPTLAVIIEA